MLRRRWVRIAALALVLAFVGTACKGDARHTAYRRTTQTSLKKPQPVAVNAVPGVPPPTELALAAVATGGVVHIHPAPGDLSVVKMLTNPTIESFPLAMFVTDRQGDWLHVRFPERPNGSTGWVQASEVTLTPVDNRIVISTSQRNLRVLDKNQNVIYETNVAVGKPATPTPLGRFYVDIWLPNPGSPYGKFMLSIAGFSDVLRSFGGGRGQIAMHGWADESAMGRNVSNGCVRMRNADIVHLSTLAPVGTPVEIIA